MLASSKFTPQQLRGLYALKAHPGWNNFIELLVTEQTRTRELLEDTADPATLHRLQGRAQVLKELMAEADHVGATLEKLGHNGL